MVLERLAKFGRRRGYMLMRCPSCMFDAKRNQLHNTCPFPELSRAISQAPCATAAACTKHPAHTSGPITWEQCEAALSRALRTWAELYVMYCLLCACRCQQVAVTPLSHKQYESIRSSTLQFSEHRGRWN